MIEKTTIVELVKTMTEEEKDGYINGVEMGIDNALNVDEKDYLIYNVIVEERIKNSSNVLSL